MWSHPTLLPPDMSRKEPSVELLQSPLFFSADDRLVESVPDRSEVTFPASSFPHIRLDGGAGLRPTLETSEVIYNHSHLLERHPKPPGSQQSRVGIIQSFQIKPESPLGARQPLQVLSPIETSPKATPDEANGAGAKMLRSNSQTSTHVSKVEPSLAWLQIVSGSATHSDKREQTSGKEGEPFSLPEGPPRFEDVETSSILSIEQLTETLNELPTLNLIGHGSKTSSQLAPVSSVRKESTPPSSETPNDSTTPDSKSVTSLDHSHSSIPPIQQLPSMPSHIQPGKAVGTAPPSPASIPAWQGFQFTRNYPQTSPTLPPPLSTSLGEEDAASKKREGLEEQLHAALKTKAHLEGQLESVVGECKALLQDRAGLQSKVAKIEAALREAERKSQEMSKMVVRVSEGKDGLPKDASSREEAKQVALALQRERQLVLSAQEALEREKDIKQKLSNELAQCKRRLTSQEPVLKGAQEQCAALQARLEQRGKEKEVVDGRLAVAEASLKNLEEAKLWLGGRLDEALSLNTKLQGELRDAKTAALAHSMRAEQLRKENEGLQNHIAELHRGMMRDKEALVGQLEAIEADVLSREEACEQLAASRLQIEDMVRGKAEEIEVLTNKLAESEMQRGELGEELAEARAAIEQITQNGLRGKNALVSKLNVLERDMAAHEANAKALEKLNTTLQERVHQVEASAVAQDGVTKGLRETCSALQRELDASKEALEVAEEKLEVAGRVNEEVEAELKVSLDQGRTRETQLRSLLEGQRASEAEMVALKKVLVEKGKEVAQRTAELGALEAQSKDVLAAFRSLQDRFQTISSGSEGVGRRDQTIAALSGEKEALEQQLVEVKEERNRAVGRLEQLQQEKARLQGELDVAKSSDMEEFRRAVQAKAVLESELGMAKLSHQQEMAKGLKKTAKLEAELKSLKDSTAQREKECHTALQERETELVTSREEHTRTQGELQNTGEQLEQTEQAKREVELALRRVDEQAATLQDVNDSLSKSNRDLLAQLQQEAGLRSEVERASSLVTLKLKQNAEERERRLQEQVAGLTLEVERLKGRLSGISTAQLCMRDHAGALEAVLAIKESSLAQLSARALEEKEEEERERVEAMLRLEQSVEGLKEELQRTKERAAVERRRAGEEVERLEQRVVELQEQHGEEVEGTRGKMEQVVRAREELQVEVGEMRVQLMAARTAADMVKQDWANKCSQVEVLQREVEGVKAHLRQAQEEAHQLRDQLRAREEQHLAELEVAPRRPPLVESTPLRKRSPSSDVISTATGFEEANTSGHTEGLCLGNLL